jgi:hypothetical protein
MASQRTMTPQVATRAATTRCICLGGSFFESGGWETPSARIQNVVSIPGSEGYTDRADRLFVLQSSGSCNVTADAGTGQSGALQIACSNSARQLSASAFGRILRVHCELRNLGLAQGRLRSQPLCFCFRVLLSYAWMCASTNHRSLSAARTISVNTSAVP